MNQQCHWCSKLAVGFSTVPWSERVPAAWVCQKHLDEYHAALRAGKQMSHMKYLTFDLESNGGFDVVEGEFDTFEEAQAHLMQVLSVNIQREAVKLEAANKLHALTTDYADAEFALGNLKGLVAAYEQTAEWSESEPTDNTYWQIEGYEVQYGIETSVQN